MNYEILNTTPRLLIEAELKPLQGSRFQPTGFADLGAARYKAPDGTDTLLVESAQSVANRLEATIWDEAKEDLIPELQSLPYIRVNNPDGSQLTNSILEAHRINSPYILEGRDRSVFERLKREAAGLEIGPVKLRTLAGLVMKYDANALLHGIFLAKSDLAGGRLRLMRVLSGFIEATGVSVAESGGVKNDRVDPSGDAKQGFGNVPFHRTEFTAKRITAYFNLDLALLRGYGLPPEGFKFLVALALFKIRRFLGSGLRLRTACDLDLVSDLVVTRPESFSIPDEAVLLTRAAESLEACARIEGLFADPHVTIVNWEAAAKKKSAKNRDVDEADAESEDESEDEDNAP